MRLFSRWVFILLIFSAIPANASEAVIQEAKNFFDQYVSFDQSFDPAASNLYSDDALIQRTRRYPTGEVKTVKIPADQYKRLVRLEMPVAKKEGNSHKFSDTTYIPEGNRVRIKATRYSEFRQSSTPFEMVVGPSSDKHWRIFEEKTELNF